MFTFNKLSAEDIAEVMDKAPTIKPEYVALLEQLSIGEGARIDLSGEGSPGRQTFRQNLNRAAASLNVAVDYKRSKNDNEVVFIVINPADKVKRGRPAMTAEEKAAKAAEKAAAKAAAEKAAAKAKK